MAALPWCKFIFLINSFEVLIYIPIFFALFYTHHRHSERVLLLHQIAEKWQKKVVKGELSLFQCKDVHDARTRPRNSGKGIKVSRVWEPSQKGLCLLKVQNLLQEQRLQVPNPYQKHLDSCR